MGRRSQAPGTLGAILQRGEPRVRMMGEEVAVEARIRSSGNCSAHADQPEPEAWVEERLPVHAGIFLAHGTTTTRASCSASGARSKRCRTMPRGALCCDG